MMKIANIKPILSIVLLSMATWHVQGQSITTQASALVAQGRIAEAIELLTNSKEPKNATYFNTLGNAWLQKGNSEKALSFFEQARTISETTSNQTQLAQAYNNIAVALWSQGKSTEALQYHQVALQKRQDLKKPLLEAASLNNIGLVYSATNPALAITYYKKAQAIYIQENIPKKIATSYVNIGLAYRNLKDYNAALAQLNKALDIRQQAFGNQSNAVAFVYSSLASVFLETQDYKFAIDYVQKAITIYQNNYGPQHPEIAASFNLWGNVNLAQGRYQQAIAHYQMALAANLEMPLSLDYYTLPPATGYLHADIYLLSMYQLALAHENLHFEKTLKIKDVAYAYSLLEIADKIIDKIRQFRVNEADKIALGNISSDVYEAAIRISLYMANVKWKKEPFIEKAFYYTDKSKSAVLLEAIADANAQSFAGIPDETLQNEKDIKGEIAFLEQKLAKALPEQRKELNSKLLSWNEKYIQFKKELETNYPDYYALKYNITTPGIKQLKERLPQGTTLLNYFIGTNHQRLYVFYVNNKGVKALDLPLSTELDKELTGFRNALYYKAGTTTAQVGYSLYQQLGLKQLPKTTQHLLIVPGGRLATIPFEALLTNPEDPYSFLVKKWEVSYLYAAGLLPEQRSTQTEGVSLFAPVEFAGQGLSYLPATKQEVEQIGSLFAEANTPANVYLEANASKEVVASKEVAQSKTLHFATHGIVDEKHPERSRICLTMQNGSSGNLFTGDIYNLKFNADLVVLSACETGLGKLSKGEGIIGLTRAIIYAGAKNMVVSLWSVADASTSQLMIEFYKNTLNNQSYAQALANAKRTMLAGGNYAEPYYWAPFVLIGE